MIILWIEKKNWRKRQIGIEIKLILKFLLFKVGTLKDKEAADGNEDWKGKKSE